MAQKYVAKPHDCKRTRRLDILDSVSFCPDFHSMISLFSKAV
uniref:Uncharacterized protein n=1 Tax=Anguilla anguilla TaxID=7936 RepID=A0A0E9W2X2_ANGAN